MNALKFNTFGVFKVSTPSGEDVTPRAQKACGILAIILESPKMSRSRVGLQDMLWSDREQAQGAASLRQALTVIRQAFGPFRDVLCADLNVVSLDPARVIHERDPRHGQFLEGIGVRDPEFEDWLRDRRLEFEDVAPVPAGVRPPNPGGRGTPDAPPVPSLFLLAAEGSHLAPFVLQAVARAVSDWGAIDVHTVRDGLDGPWGRADTFVLEVGDRRIGQNAAIRLSMSSAVDGRVLWQDTAMLPLSDAAAGDLSLARLINNAADRTADTIARESGPGALLLPMREIFEVQAKSYGAIADRLGALRQRLELSSQQTGRGIYAAWLGQTTVIQMINEQWHANDRRSVRLKAEQNIQETLESESHNPTALAIASLVNSTVLMNHSVARELAERSVALNPHGPLGWAYLGLSSVHNQRLPEAYEQLKRARALSGEGPYRYAVDAIACVTNLLTGRLDMAMQIGETVHARMPDYAPNLRYLLGAYLVAKDMPKVERTVERLRRIEPGFTLSLLAEPEYPVNSLRTNELLSLKSLPKSI
jgi:tetratricopeptide (TPR) repeat protein